MQNNQANCNWCDGNYHTLAKNEDTMLFIADNRLIIEGEDEEAVEINYSPHGA